LITITRLLAKQLLTVLKRLIPRGGRNRELPVKVETGPQGLLIEANSSQFGFQYREPGRLPKHSLTVTPELLHDVAGTKPIPVTMAPSSKNQVRVQWQEGVVPKSALFALPDSKHKPADLVAPTVWAQNPPEVLSVLHQTMAISDSKHSRYALGCVQFNGKAGEFAATDGCQIILHSGIKLNFNAEILVPASMVYGSPELVTDASVLFGKTETHFAVQTGPWTIFTLIQKEGRFPRVHEVFPNAKTPKTTLQLSPADIAFLTQTIPQLPCHDENFLPITVDLKSNVAIRARGDDGPPTELILRGSSHEGADVRLNINRTFLERALKLGFDRIQVHDKGQPVQCCDARRRYAWMTLEDSGAIPASKNAIVIESPTAEAPVQTRSTKSVPSTPNTIPMRRRRTQFAPAPTTAPQTQAPKSTGKPSGPGLIEQVTELRVAAKDLYAKTTELLRSMKRQRRQHRIMQSTLQSLKELQQVA
jgi:hypothetical protein